MAIPVFITGIGTGIGKTIVSAIITQALNGAYWKPVQAGLDGPTDSDIVRSLLTNKSCRVLPETYRLATAASPHIAARSEKIKIDLSYILRDFDEAMVSSDEWLIIEGAGGLLVPLNETETVLDLIVLLKVPVIIVSRNYLGSINHSLLTARALKMAGVAVYGWFFNDRFMDYEKEIAEWTDLPILGMIPFTDSPDQSFIANQAIRVRAGLLQHLT